MARTCLAVFHPPPRLPPTPALYSFCTAMIPLHCVSPWYTYVCASFLATVISCGARLKRRGAREVRRDIRETPLGGWRAALGGSGLGVGAGVVSATVAAVTAVSARGPRRFGATIRLERQPRRGPQTRILGALSAARADPRMFTPGHGAPCSNDALHSTAYTALLSLSQRPRCDTLQSCYLRVSQAKPIARRPSSHHTDGRISQLLLRIVVRFHKVIYIYIYIYMCMCGYI